MANRFAQEKQSMRQSRSLLDEVLERRIALYVLAAGAALAAVPLADAQVIFTPSNAVVPRNAPLFQIDMNNDGVVDFALHNFSFKTSPFCLSSIYRCVYSRLSAVGLIGPNGEERQGKWAAALKVGAEIGADETFARQGPMAYYRGMMPTERSGPFFNVTTRFLGVQFQINGEIHYGWIGFRKVTASPFGDFTAYLLGWAYETKPNTPIRAGQGYRESSAMLPAEPTSLELLARGHDAVADWRRRAAA